MKSSSQRKWGILLSYVSIILNNTISIIYTPFMLQIMGQSEYGLLGTASSYVSYLSLFSFGISGSYIRYNTKYRSINDKESEEKLNGMFFIIFSLLSILVIIGGVFVLNISKSFLSSSFSQSEIFKLNAIMISMIANTVFTFLFTVVMMALQAYEKFFFLKTWGLLTGLLTPILNIIVLLSGGRSISLSIVTLVVALISYLSYLFYAIKAIKFRCRFKGIDIDVLKEVIRFSAFLFINSLTDQLTFSTDNIILSKYFGTTSVAIYTVGSSFKTYFMNFSTSISSVFSSKINMLVAKEESNESLTNLMISVGRIQCMVTSLILIGFLFLGEDFILLWAGKEYKDAYWIAVFLMLAIYVPCFQNIGLEIQKAKNKHKSRSIVYFIIAILNIILTIPTAKLYGGIGASISTFISLFMGTVIFMNIYYQKSIGLNMKKFWNEILKLYPGMIPAIIIAIIINDFLIIKSFFDILFAAVIITVIYCIGLWTISLKPQEKQLFKFKKQIYSRVK